ncbi:PAS domain-containing protein [Jannaschia sp. Os4]|uniref:sensor histidine kinase n=1 Tax=Jannaschia sp. Os4 TaxID=2807617 RepID=UPI00193A124F|nr:HWE histidine kinase domain-containing protein [Jannaschia sp. Os4]MBM2577536.1 PAS domain-containing protein [Jannaschia sp. Os4]
MANDLAEGFLREDAPHWADLAPLAAEVGRWAIDPSTGSAEGDSALADLTGLPEVAGPFDAEVMLARIDPGDRAAVETALDGVAEGPGRFETVFRFRRPDGGLVWLEASGRMMTVDGRRMLVGATHDVTELREAQMRAELVAGEMAHRIKNLFALVQSIFTMAARGAGSVPELQEAFEGRLRALAGLNAMTLGDREAKVALSDLVSAAAGQHVAAGRMRNVLPDPCDIAGGAAQTMVLLLNELVTNAVKHGALRDGDGTVDLKVTLEDGKFTFEWAEENDAPVAPPTRKGFGMRVLTGMTASTYHGRPEVEWTERGLRFRCTWPMQGFTA